MQKFPSFYVYFVLSIVGNILLIEYCLAIFDLVPKDVKLPETPRFGFPIPSEAVRLLPSSSVPICKGCDESPFLILELTSGIQNSRLVRPGERPDADFPTCELLYPIVKALAQNDQSSCQCSCQNHGIKCDLSKVVFILTKGRDDELRIIGQGIKLCDGTILTSYGVTQVPAEQLFVQCSNNCIKKVICMQKLRQLSSFGGELFYTVQFVLEEDSCSSCSCGYNCDCSCGCRELETQIPTGTIFVEGFLVQPTSNKTCPDYGLTFAEAVGVLDPTGLFGSLVLAKNKDDLTRGGQGGLFITPDCRIIGMTVAKPFLLTSTVVSIPFLNEIDIRCVTFLVPIRVD